MVSSTRMTEHKGSLHAAQIQLQGVPPHLADGGSLWMSAGLAGHALCGGRSAAGPASRGLLILLMSSSCLHEVLSGISPESSAMEVGKFSRFWAAPRL